MSDHTPQLERLAQMARQQPTLLVGLLATYQKQEELTEAGLAEFLEGDTHALTLLALCRRPRIDPDRFHSDVEQIADYTHVNAVQLAQLVQTATGYEQRRGGTASHPVGPKGNPMSTSKYAVELGYRRDDLLALFATASQADVEDEGRYDARGAAINIWTHGWHHKGTREESETMGTLYFRWGNDTCYLREIECDEGFDKGDLLRELGILEEKALGRRVHGNE